MPSGFGPTIRVQSTLRGLNGATKKLEPSALLATVRDSLEDTLRELVQLVQDFTPEDTGDAAAGTYFRIEGDSLTNLEGVISNPESYFATLNYGRRAGAPYPPPGPIEEWAERHGISLSAVYPIQRAISERGLLGWHMLERAIEQSRGHFKGVFLRHYIEMWRESSND